LGLKVGSKKSF